ncbi:MAG: tyrosine-type recombinase/integrase [Planctomycetes bacterium]|nr:tyrosine-type recombinase/integrase [Planctomycetota bacterium]
MSDTTKQKRNRKENPHSGFSLARPVYKASDGKKRKSAIHHARFKDVAGIWRRLPLFTDAQSSAAFARKLVLVVSLRAAGESLGAELSRWTDSLAPKLRDRLVLWGIVEQLQIEVVKTLLEHMDDWKQSVKDTGSGENNAKLRYTRVKKVLLYGCGYIRFTDIDSLHVTAYLAAMNCATRTRNHFNGALRQFCKFMVKNKFATHSPLETLTNVKITDEKRRRSLTAKEFTKLLQTTLNGPKDGVDSPIVGGMSGFERSTLYWLASETGYRRNEIASLTKSSINLDSVPATVEVLANATKNKRDSKLSITGELGQRLKTLLRGKSPAAPAFKMPEKTAQMIKQDLEQAGIPFITQDGRFDFHSLRVQLAATLIRANCNIKVVQSRLRHQDSKLTLDIYSRLGQSEVDAAAVAALPRMNIA